MNEDPRQMALRAHAAAVRADRAAGCLLWFVIGVPVIVAVAVFVFLVVALS